MKTAIVLLAGTDPETVAVPETEMMIVISLVTEIPGLGEMTPGTVTADGPTILLI